MFKFTIRSNAHNVSSPHLDGGFVMRNNCFISDSSAPDVAACPNCQRLTLLSEETDNVLDAEYIEG